MCVLTIQQNTRYHVAWFQSDRFIFYRIVPFGYALSGGSVLQDAIQVYKISTMPYYYTVISIPLLCQ